MGEIERQSGYFNDIAAAVRKGGTTMPGDGTIEPENPLWVTFARSMAPMMRLPSEAIAKLIDAPAGKNWKVLDIAAGHGMYGIAVAKQNPNARIVAADWAAVLEVARENAEKAGVSERYSVLPGSAFEVEFGTGYDVVLLTNFLHHFSIEACEGLLEKIHAAMKPNGIVVTLEFIPNEDRISPAVDAVFSHDDARFDAGRGCAIRLRSSKVCSGMRDSHEANCMSFCRCRKGLSCRIINGRLLTTRGSDLPPRLF